MNFAVLALLGLVSAKRSVFDNLDFEIEEALKVHYPMEAVQEYERQGMHFKEFILTNLPTMEANLHKTLGPIAERWSKIGPKYLPELEAWGNSKSVQAKNDYGMNVIMPSQLMHELMEDGEELVENFMDGDLDAGNMFTNEGYTEWIDNGDLRDILEDLYEVKEAFKALVESKMARENDRLGMETLADEHFQKIWTWFQEDMEVSGLEGLAKKCCETLKAMKAKARDCPIQKEMKKRIIKLLRTIEATKQVSDLGSPAKWEKWARKENFQPWN